MNELEEIINKVDSILGTEIQDEMILAVSNSYIKKYYLDDMLEKSLPEDVKNELKKIMVNFTLNFGGVLECRYFDKYSTVEFFVVNDENDFEYDEIDANLNLNRIKKEYNEFLESLAIYVKLKLHQVDKFIDLYSKHSAHDDHHDCNCEHKH